eukprot:GEMP01043100.1.p1 GENE.GEMP01043100.1~~GEMP01043100.1.p1  ORF type:complete len:415 (-),score=34.84 GEMP01043100.1:486-1730(-)
MALFLGSLIYGAYAHGRMTDPPSRNHLMNNEYDKNSLWHPTNRCGSGSVTRKVYDNSATGEFDVIKTLSPGQVFTVSLSISANHIGKHWFEYACMDGNLNVPTGKANVQWKRLAFEDGKMETDKSGSYSCQPNSRFLSGSTCRLRVRFPSESCNHGVLNWNWMAVHNSPHEWYKNCADIKIGAGGSTTKTRPAVPGPRPAVPGPRPVVPRPRPTSPSTKDGTCMSKNFPLECVGWKSLCTGPFYATIKAKCQDYCECLKQGSDGSSANPRPAVPRPNPTTSRPRPAAPRPRPTPPSTQGGTCMSKNFPRQCVGWKSLCTGPFYANIKSMCQEYCECLNGGSLGTMPKKELPPQCMECKEYCPAGRRNLNQSGATFGNTNGFTVFTIVGNLCAVAILSLVGMLFGVKLHDKVHAN